MTIIKEYGVWTLKHKREGNIVTVALPEYFIPDDDWEYINYQSLKWQHEDDDER